MNKEIPKNTKVVIIGGGVAGTSCAYHLAKFGWKDVVLLERDQLTSGTTWHAAGLLPLFNMSYSVGQIHKYSVQCYQELEKETHMNVGFRNVSNIRLASNQDRMDEYRQYAGVASTIGVEVNAINAAVWKTGAAMMNCPTTHSPSPASSTTRGEAVGVAEASGQSIILRAI